MKIRDKVKHRVPVKVASTSERLQQIMLAKNIKQIDLARSTGIPRGSISNYVVGRYEPKSDIVQKLANALNCSDMWLWGYDVPMEKSSRSFEDEENPYVLEIGDVVDQMSIDDQIYAAEWIKAFAKNPAKMKKAPGEVQLTEGEWTMLEIFRLIPADQQKVFLDMGRVYANSLKKE